MSRRERPRAQNPPEAALPIRNLGRLGVNVVDSPIHLQDGELRQAQNAEPYDVRGEGALRKRAGIALFTADDLGAPVSAMTSVPLPDPFPPFTGIAYLGAGSAPAAHYSDDTVSSWSDTTSPDPGASTGASESRGFQSSAGVLYYIAGGSFGGTVSAWRGPGQASSTFGSEPTGGSVVIDAVYSILDAARWPGGVCGDTDTDTLFFLVQYGVHDDTPSAWILYKWQIGVDSAFTQLGQGFKTNASATVGYISDAVPSAYGHPVFWQGRVWLAINSNSGSNPKIYSIAVGESVWTLETTLSGTSDIGALYTDPSANFLWFTRKTSPETLRRRDTAGVYTTQYTSTAGELTPAYAADDTIYVIENQSSTGWIVKLSTNGGTSWSTVYSNLGVHALAPANFRAGVAFDGQVYLINKYGETVRVTGTAALLDTWASDFGGEGVLVRA